MALANNLNQAFRDEGGDKVMTSLPAVVLILCFVVVDIFFWRKVVIIITASTHYGCSSFYWPSSRIDI